MQMLGHKVYDLAYTTERILMMHNGFLSGYHAGTSIHSLAGLQCNIHAGKQ